MKPCSACGQPLPAEANFCPVCGTPVDPPPGSRDATTGSFEPVAVGGEPEAGELADVPPLAPGMGMLVVVHGPGSGSRFLLDRELTSVGRHPDTDIFLDDVTVSRHHAEFVREPTGIAVRDLGSLNGTYIGTRRVEYQVLATGDELQIGRFKLLFVGEDAAGGVGHRP